MFPYKTALINSLEVLLSSNYNFNTAIYMCVLGSQKMKLQLLLHLPLKQVETGRLSIKNLFKRCWNSFICCFLTAPNKVRGARQNAGLTYMVITRLSYCIKGEINKRRKKEIPHGIFFPHHNFSIFFREMPANN